MTLIWWNILQLYIKNKIFLSVLTDKDRSLRYIFKLKNKLQDSVYCGYYFVIKTKYVCNQFMR